MLGGGDIDSWSQFIMWSIDYTVQGKFRAVLTCLGPWARQADRTSWGEVSGVGDIVLCTSESGNAQLGPNNCRPCQIAKRARNGA